MQQEDVCQYPAHIRVEEKEKVVQSVSEHCRNVAEYASYSMSSLGLKSTAYLAGLLHDMGKYTSLYKEYLDRASSGEKVIRGSVNHTFSGVIYLLERYHGKDKSTISRLTCEILAFAVGSHHGEFDCVDINGMSGFEYRRMKDRHEILYWDARNNFISLCAQEDEIDRLFADSLKEIESILRKVRALGKKRMATYILGLVARMVLSSVIDADRRDTAEFMMNRRLSSTAGDCSLWSGLSESLTIKMANFQADTPINKARAYFSDACYQSGKQHEGGIYRLTLPTGAGKTLSSLRYALSNAESFNKKHVIFVIPLLSVLEQNSSVIRKYVGNDSIILEHHSNFVNDVSTEDALDEYELLMDTWDSPIIITTLVQLLNTLCSGKTSSIRRMKALANSVIVIDEVQSLPKKTLYMFNASLNYLAYVCGATIVLSSATQPVFNTVEIPLKISEPSDIVPFDEMRNAIFKRTVVHDATTKYGMSLEELEEFSSDKFSDVQSMLIICNTKSTAIKLFDRVRQRNRGVEVFHLSASMCMKHRKDTVERIKRCLAEKVKMICVSTQLVEAGVDLSFQRVIRVLAGMDNVAQSAGRCNRSGDYGALCDVFLVNLKEGEENLKMLKEIYASQRSTQDTLYSFYQNPQSFDNDLISEKSIRNYYEHLFCDPEVRSQFEYRKLDMEGREMRLFRLLSDNSELAERNLDDHYVLKQSFKTAGALFEVFDENTTDVIVPYDDTSRRIISDLVSEKAKWDISMMLRLVEEAKPYLIRIFEYQKRMLSDDGMLFSDLSGHFMILNDLCYDSESGLIKGDVFL